MKHTPSLSPPLCSRRVFCARLLAASLIGVSAIAGCGDLSDEAPTSEVAAGAMSAPAASAPPVVVIIHDVTNKSNLPLQAKIINRFIRENAMIGEANVYLITMDRAPKVHAFFPAQKLLHKSESDVLKALGNVTSQDGTDVVTALEKGRDKLFKSNGATPSGRILLVFSDTTVDAATTPTHKDFRPLTQFDWSSLQGTECHFFFVRDDQGVKALLDAQKIPNEVLDRAESEQLSLQPIAE